MKERCQERREVVSDILKGLLAPQLLKLESASAMSRLVDTAVECILRLQVMERPVDQWDDMLITSKLHLVSRRLGEQVQRRKMIPTFKQLTEL
jgi:hypothetical protein